MTARKTAEATTFLAALRLDWCKVGTANFYGTTTGGGNNNNNGLGNFGIIFRLTPSGSLTTIYNFCAVLDAYGDCEDGSDPLGTLVLGSDATDSPSTATDFVIFVYASTTTTLAISPAAVPSGATVNMVATVAQPAGNACCAQGTVSFYDGGTSGTLLGTTTVGGGTATLSLVNNGDGALPVGTYQVTAAFTPSAYNLTSTSAAQSITVYPPGYSTQTLLNFSPNPVAQGQTFTLTAEVLRSGGSGNPTGNVTFYYQTQALGTAALNNGVAKLNFIVPTTLTVGSYGLTTTY